MYSLKKMPRGAPILLIGLLAVFACSDDDEEEGVPTNPDPTSTVFEVEIRGEFDGFVDGDGDNVHNVAVGDTIEWVNLDVIVHTATSTSVPTGGAGFDSQNLSQNGTSRFVPQVAGTWDYHCTVHPLTMTGTITAN